MSNDQPTNFDLVRQFMQTMGQDVPQRPTWPTEKVASLRVELIREELNELEGAIDEVDMIGVADAITDLLYVVYGAAVAFGIDANGCFKEVHDSNMTKMTPDGTVIRDEHGKVKKPPTFREPNIFEVLSRRIQPDVNPFE